MDVNKVAVGVKELFQLEIDWLKSLPIDDKNKLFPDYVDLNRDHPINHICVTGEIALVILGIKPCCAVNHGYHTDYGKMLYEQVVKPWYNKHFDDEGGCNFVCESTKPGTAYYTGTLFDGGPGKRVDWGNSMLFWNISHPESILLLMCSHVPLAQLAMKNSGFALESLPRILVEGEIHVPRLSINFRIRQIYIKSKTCVARHALSSSLEM